MLSLKAWGQRSEAPAHLQLRHCPTGSRLGKRLNARVADLVSLEVKRLCRASTANQTKLSGLKNVCANSEGMGARQWGASSPVTAPWPLCRRHRQKPLRPRQRSGCCRGRASAHGGVYQTKLLSQENARAKAQGLGARQWRASAPLSAPVPRWRTHRRWR